MTLGALIIIVLSKSKILILRADIIINNEIVLEFKTIRTLNDAAELQGSNYLRL